MFNSKEKFDEICREYYEEVAPWYKQRITAERAKYNRGQALLAKAKKIGQGKVARLVKHYKELVAGIEDGSITVPADN